MYAFRACGAFLCIMFISTTHAQVYQWSSGPYTDSDGIYKIEYAASNKTKLYEIHDSGDEVLIKEPPNSSGIFTANVVSPNGSNRYLTRTQVCRNIGTPEEPEIRCHEELLNGPTVVVNSPTPNVTLTRPLTNKTLYMGQTEALSADASVTVGSIASVRFTANGNTLFEDTSAPFQFNWTPAAADTYIVKAIATDNNGDTTAGDASAKTIRIVNSTPPPPPPPLPDSGPATPIPPVMATPTISSTSSDKVGTVLGQFRVDETGSATYDIPLFNAPGVAGVEPNISLMYSSQGRNGLLGKGWKITGLSAITRCRPTLHQEGTSGPIRWNSSDRFCLDGQRLVVVSGQYGAAGSTYKTDIDRFVTVTQNGGSLGHPSHFTVTGKDGSTKQYGGTSHSKYLAPGSSNVLTWGLNQSTDSVGNAINYEYNNDANGFRISRIYYAYGSDNTPNAQMDFNYELNRPDHLGGYVSGYEFVTRARLSSVTSRSEGPAVRHYRLRYLPTDDENPISRLGGITECNGAGDICLPETAFNWPNFDFSRATSISSGVDISTPGNDRAIVGFQYGDINGDGAQDSIYHEVDYDGTQIDRQYIRAVLSDGRGFTRLHTAYSSGGNSKVLLPWQVIDYNADGHHDIVVYENNRWTLVQSQPGNDGEWQLVERVELPLTQKETVFFDANSDGLFS